MEILNIDSFLAYYDSVRKRTNRVIEKVPPDRLEWAPAAGMFSFGDVIRHIAAIERYMFAENVVGRPSRYPGHERSLADGYENVVRFFHEKHRETLEILRGLTDERLR